MRPSVRALCVRRSTSQLWPDGLHPRPAERDRLSDEPQAVVAHAQRPERAARARGDPARPGVNPAQVLIGRPRAGVRGWAARRGPRRARGRRGSRGGARETRPCACATAPQQARADGRDGDAAHAAVARVGLAAHQAVTLERRDDARDARRRHALDLGQPAERERPVALDAHQCRDERRTELVAGLGAQAPLQAHDEDAQARGELGGGERRRPAPPPRVSGTMVVTTTSLLR